MGEVVAVKNEKLDSALQLNYTGCVCVASPVRNSSGDPESYRENMQGFYFGGTRFGTEQITQDGKSIKWRLIYRVFCSL